MRRGDLQGVCRGEEKNVSVLLPAMVVGCVLMGMRAKVSVYDAFIRGAKEGLMTLGQMAPCLCAMMTAVALMRETGLMDAMSALMEPALSRIGIPREAAALVLLRPLSGSAALAAIRQVMEQTGADSRAARLCCVICGASETVFFTGSLYLGAAGVKKSRYAVFAALAAYAAGVLAAAMMV